MKTSILIASLTVSLAIATEGLHAQESAEEEPIIKAEFTVYSLKRLQDLKFIHGDRKGASALEFFSSARSRLYEYEGPNPIIFIRETPAPTIEDPNAVNRSKVAELSLPEEGGEFLFIFFPDSSRENEKYRIYPLDDSKSKLPNGSIRLFNATSFQLEGVFGQNKIKLAPGPSKAYRIPGNSMSLGLGFRYDGKFHMSHNGPVKLETDSRGLFMLFPPFVKGSAILQTRYLRDSEPEPKQDLEVTSESPPQRSTVR
jgi:hypothetical protein